MTWTYTGDPATNARDSVRFLIGDTDTNDQLLNDDEIAWLNKEVTGSTTATTGLYGAAYRACITIASKFSREADKSVGDLSISAQQKATAYRALSKELKGLASQTGATPTPYAGGISVSDKQSNQEDSDIYQAWFESGQFDNPRGDTGQVLADFGAGAD